MSTTNAQPTNNREQWYQTRYAQAHALLNNSDDPYRAEHAFNALLQEVHIPLWMRVQCTAILANITDEPRDAQAFLEDAKHILGLFVDEQVSKYKTMDASPHREAVEQMREEFTQVSKGILERRDGWDTTAPTATTHTHGPDPEMLLGNTAEEEAAAMQTVTHGPDPEMLLGNTAEEEAAVQAAVQQGVAQLGLAGGVRDTSEAPSEATNVRSQASGDSGTAPTETDVTSQYASSSQAVKTANEEDDSDDEDDAMDRA